VAVLIAVAIIPLIAIIGVATDSARGFYAKSRLSSAVDAAALAGGQVFFEDRRASDARQFFDANFPPGFMGSKVTQWVVDPPQGVKPESDDKTFTVRASVEIPTIFMRLFGKNSMIVSSYAEATRESKALDVVLAIDMSTSMNDKMSDGETRLAHAKSAALKLVEVLYGEQSEVEYLRIGIVPWAGSVNVTYDGSRYGYDWTDNDGDGEFDDSEYTPRAVRVTKDTTFGTYYNYHRNTTIDEIFKDYKSPHGETYHGTIYFAHNSPVPLLSEPLFDPDNDPDTDPESAAPKAVDDYAHKVSRVWDGCVWARWEQGKSNNADDQDGLTDDWLGWSPKGIESHLVDGSGSMYYDVTGMGVHYDRTFTEGYGRHEQTIYAKREDICPASSKGGEGRNSECTPCPGNGITPLTKGKAPIDAAIGRLGIPKRDQGFGTDIPQGLAWGWRVVSPAPPFVESATYQPGYEPSRAVVLLTDGANDAFVGDAYNGGLSDSDMDDRLKDIADNMKADNDGNGEPDYEIYVIQFANSSGDLAELMKQVATEPNAPYYFNAPTGEQLEAAFNEIGNHLSNLRLSK